MKTYAMPKWLWLLPLFLTGIVANYYFTTYPAGSKVFMTLLCLLGWYMMLSMPLKIELNAENQVIFRGVLKTTVVNIDDILAIKRGGKTHIIKYRGGKVEISYIISNVEEFLADLKRLNPAIVEEENPLLKFSQSPVRVMVLVFGLVVLALVIAALAIYIPSVGHLF